MFYFFAIQYIGALFKKMINHVLKLLVTLSPVRSVSTQQRVNVFPNGTSMLGGWGVMNLSRPHKSVYIHQLSSSFISLYWDILNHKQCLSCDACSSKKRYAKFLPFSWCC